MDNMYEISKHYERSSRINLIIHKYVIFRFVIVATMTIEKSRGIVTTLNKLFLLLHGTNKQFRTFLCFPSADCITKVARFILH